VLPHGEERVFARLEPWLQVRPSFETTLTRLLQDEAGVFAALFLSPLVGEGGSASRSDGEPDAG
jgi:hypothetical protein